MNGGVVPAGRLQVRAEGLADEGPEPGFIDQATASFRSTQDEVSVVQEKRYFDGYQELEQALVERGYDRAELRQAPNKFFGLINLGRPQPVMSRAPDAASIWAAVQGERERDPSAFANIPKTQDEYEKWLYTRRGARGRDQDVLRRGDSLTASLAGGIGGSFTDPVNVLTLPLGGGKTVGAAVLREAGINAGIEALQTPDLIRNRARMGEETSARDAATNIVLAGVAGGLLGGASKGVELHGGDLIAAGRERTIAAVWDKLPAPVRLRWAKASDIREADLPELAELAIGRDNMTPAERGAVDALRGDADLAARNPFVPNGAGIAAHQGRFEDALGGLLDPLPPGQRPRFTLPERPVSSPSDLRGGTAIGSGTVPVGARAEVKRRIGVVESGGNDRAANPRSSATGRYQFTQGTWLAYYKRRFGTGGLSNDAILTKRADGRLQDVLMDDLLSDNAAFLNRAGEAETAGNLYLVHFAGQGGAGKLFRADPGASARSVLGDAVVRANPFLKDMNAGEVIAWAHRKMGGSGAPVRGDSRVRVADDGPDEGGYRAQLQDELDRTEAEIASLREELDPEAEARVAAAADAEPVFVEAETAPEPARPIEAAARAPDAPRAEVLALLPDLRRIATDGGASLNDMAALARSIGADEGDVRRGLEALAGQGAIRMRRDGRFARVPRETGPVDALKFIARAGGIRDDEGHGLGLKSVGARAERGMTAAAKAASRRRRAGGRRDLQRFVPGAGPLLRTEGRSIDAIGELLWEANYFPSSAERPDTAAVLDFIEEAMGTPRFPIGEEPEARFSDWQDGEYEFFAGRLRGAAETMQVKLDDAAIDDILTGFRGSDLTPEEAVAEHINGELDAVRFDLFADSEKDIYDALDEDFAATNAGQGENRGTGSQGPGRDAGDPRAGRTGSEDGAAAAEAPRAGDDALKRFDDPAGPDARAQAGSLEHDAQMDAFGGATRGEERAALERKGEGRMQSGAAQRPPGSDGGLFDSQARPVEFRFGEDDGDVQSLGDMLDGFDAEAAQAKAARDCL